MNKSPSTHDYEIQKGNPSAIDTAFLWLIRTGIFAIVCFTISTFVHDAYMMAVLGQLHA